MRKKNICAWAVVVVMVLIAAAGACWATGPQGGIVEGTVERVIDGDTIEVNVSGERRRVRLIGIDCGPLRYVWDRHGLGRVAKRWVESKVASANVYLEYDIEPTDKYGRDLAYVWLASPDVLLDGMINAQLLQEGLAVPSRHPPNVKYSDLFNSYRRGAREAGRGVWGLTSGDAPR